MCITYYHVGKFFSKSCCPHASVLRLSQEPLVAAAALTQASQVVIPDSIVDAPFKSGFDTRAFQLFDKAFELCS